MALIQCPECGKEMSDQASACPNCGSPVKKPADLKFCKFCGAQIDKECVVCPKCGKQVEELKSQNSDKNIVINNNNVSSSSSSAAAYGGNVANLISPKSRLMTLLFCLFLGFAGVHRFYVGKAGSAIVMILLMFTGIGEIWLFIDFILILLGSFTDGHGFKIKNW